MSGLFYDIRGKFEDSEETFTPPEVLLSLVMMCINVLLFEVSIEIFRLNYLLVFFSDLDFPCSLKMH